MNRSINRWFEKTVCLRTGWPLGDVFSLSQEKTRKSVFISPPKHVFDSSKFDLSAMISSKPLTDRGQLTYDLPGFAAWCLSRRQEHCAHHDWSVAGRIPNDMNIGASAGFADTPYVDRLISLFVDSLIIHRDRIGLQTPKRQTPWPSGKKAAFCMTHDVDLIDGRTNLWARKLFWQAKQISAGIREKTDEAAKWKNRLERWSRMSEDPVWSIPRWIEKENRLGLRPTYFFLSLRSNLGPEGRRYKATHPRLKEGARLILENGYEVGLHAASRKADCPGNLTAQRDRLEKSIGEKIGSVRHHFLNVRFPESWRIIDRAGFSVSSNMAFNGGMDGFRAGTCFPYHPFDLIESDGDLTEIPFCIMDRSIIADSDAFYEKALGMLAEVKKVGGVFAINFHTDYFDEREAPGVHATWSKIATAVAGDSELWHATLSEVADHFPGNARLSCRR